MWKRAGSALDCLELLKGEMDVSNEGGQAISEWARSLKNMFSPIFQTKEKRKCGPLRDCRGKTARVCRNGFHFCVFIRVTPGSAPTPELQGEWLLESGVGGVAW